VQGKYAHDMQMCMVQGKYAHDMCTVASE
jgi:hypothetical protein